uniref:Peptidase S1 domain-containing protein n=1 Tax=Trichuris muris TaxID=70415 RepID=A0A5S6QA04_TRIMR
MAIAQVLWAIVAYFLFLTSSAETECGLPAVNPSLERDLRMDNRISRGWNALPLSLPWMVSLSVWINDVQQACCGFLIKNGSPNETDLVLTAAHCVSRQNKFASPDNIAVGIGSLEAITSRGDKIWRYVRNYLTFLHNTETHDNDIALLKLVNPVEYNDQVKPLCLPGMLTAAIVPEACYAAGWGLTEQGSSSEILQLTQVHLQLDHISVNRNPSDRTKIHVQNAHEGSHGDSGSPLFCRLAGRYYAIGVLSLGPSNCDIEKGVTQYTRLDAYLQWISSAVEQLQNSTSRSESYVHEVPFMLRRKTDTGGSLISDGYLNGRRMEDGLHLIASLNGYHSHRL